MPQPDRGRVLVIDDEPSLCAALEIALRLAGFAADTALSGEAALARIRTTHYDLLLVDLRIPDLRGDVIYELAAAIQPHLRHQTLFLTGDITDRAGQLIDACHCPLIRKPFQLDDVFDALHALAPMQRREESA